MSATPSIAPLIAERRNDVRRALSSRVAPAIPLLLCRYGFTRSTGGYPTLHAEKRTVGRARRRRCGGGGDDRRGEDRTSGDAATELVRTGSGARTADGD